MRLSKDEETKFFVVEKKLTTREIIEGSNRVLQVKNSQVASTMTQRRLL